MQQKGPNPYHIPAAARNDISQSSNQCQWCHHQLAQACIDSFAWGRNGKQRNNYCEKAALKLTLQSDSKAMALSQCLPCSNYTYPKPGESCWHSPSLVSHFVHERKRIPWFQGAVGNPLKLSVKTSWDQCKIAFKKHNYSTSGQVRVTIRHAEWPGKCNKQPLCGSWLMHMDVGLVN